MIHLANVLLAASDKAFAADLLGRLEKGGYKVRLATSGAEALDAARREDPDIAILGPSLADMDLAGLAEALKTERATADMPVFLIVEKATPAFLTRALDLGVDDVMDKNFDEHVLLARLRPLGRLATMHSELHHRVEVANRFGIACSDEVARPTLESGYALLLVGRDLGDVAAIVGGECDLTVTDNLFEAQDLLTARNFDAAVLVPSGNSEEYLALCGQIRNNPRLFNLPVVLAGDPGSFDPIEAYRRGASRVLLRPLQAAAVHSGVVSLVRRQRLRWEIRMALTHTSTPASRDPLTGLYNRDFMTAHLERRIEAARASNRHLTVIFFSIPNVDGVREHFGDESADHLAQQLGQWITGLLRVEDLTARYQANEFAVILPDTPLDEAEIVMHRIAGVITYTDFAVKDVYQPVKVWVAVGSAQLEEGETTEALIARARRNLD
ncbi:MAG: diguanylate cyclase [Alphaproteobacteria bacterium]|nr:diguanylate cyclase [Alphaproteobacteria bacterium]